MILYFTNDSRQKKKILETDYVEDLYDEIAAFFEEHHFRPHYLETVETEAGWQIRFGSQTELFLIEEVSEDAAEELRAIANKNPNIFEN